MKTTFKIKHFWLEVANHQYRTTPGAETIIAVMMKHRWRKIEADKHNTGIIWWGDTMHDTRQIMLV